MDSIFSLIENKTEFTHYLIIEIIKSESSEHLYFFAEDIDIKGKAFINSKLSGEKIEKINGIDVCIQWNETKDLGCYYTNSMYNDKITEEFTKKVLHDIWNQFDKKDDCELTYMIFRPCTINIPIPGDRIKPVLGKRKREDEDEDRKKRKIE